MTTALHSKLQGNLQRGSRNRHTLISGTKSKIALGILQVPCFWKALSSGTGRFATETPKVVYWKKKRLMDWSQNSIHWAQSHSHITAHDNFSRNIAKSRTLLFSWNLPRNILALQVASRLSHTFFISCNLPATRLITTTTRDTLKTAGIMWTEATSLSAYSINNVNHMSLMPWCLVRDTRKDEQRML